MKNHLILVWLFPLLFMVHDFEEIIFLRAWFLHNREYINKRFPGIGMRFASGIGAVSPQAFALGVAEEFVIISAVTVLSVTFQNYLVWLGFFFVFSLHLVVHLIQSMILRRYIPCTVTTIAILPYCIYTYSVVIKTAIQPSMLASAALSTVFMVLNLIFIHRMMGHYDRWREKYEQTKRRDNDDTENE